MHPLKSLGLSALVLALLFAPASTQARDDSPSAARAELGRAAPVPLLWKLSSVGSGSTVYLLGSFHLLKPDDYPLSSDIDQAFAAADAVVFEVPPEQLADPATARKFLAAAGYADGGGLSDTLPAAMQDRLDDVLGNNGASIEQLEAFEPWFVNLTLMLGVAQSLGFSAADGLDQHLMRAAAAADKPTGGLEIIDDQLNTLDSVPMDEQVIALADFLDRPQEMPAVLTGLHEAWRSADLVALDRLTRLQMLENTPETYRLVNVVRNDAWVPQIQRMLDGPSPRDTLVVVGALHLLGADGVVEKLRAKGYTVQRICSACEAVSHDEPL
ncbi:TraB/GumN family protein [Lysobacter sp. D1-1-M9]|uniref:TraB/GumN family protein n=1 Tax=Novilysobacter longmucuonensis TaxID=3098603 RepID=UPI002FC6D29C